MSRPTDRSARVRAISVVTGAVAGAVATGLVLAALPAHGQPAVPVNCSNGKVVLQWDHLTYDLHGTCGVVVVAADDTTVSMPAATRLVVRGRDNAVDAGTLTELLVEGRANHLTTPSVRRLRLASPATTVDVAGLVEEALLGRGPGTLHARQVTALVARGSHHDVRARRGYDVRLSGDRNRVAFGRLEALHITGDRNVVRVRRGSTEVGDAGTGNRVRTRPRH